MDKETFTLIGSIIGASAWLAPLVYEKLRTAKLVGKVISCISIDNMKMTDNQTGKVMSAGIFYLYKLSVSSLGANFHPKELAIQVEYFDDTSLKGRVYVPRNINANFNGEPHRISPPRELMFPNVCVFPKDTAQHVYIPFMVDRATECEVKRVKFCFSDYRNKESIVEIDFTEIPDGSLMFEEIFTPRANT